MFIVCLEEDYNLSLGNTVRYTSKVFPIFSSQLCMSGKLGNPGNPEHQIKG